MTPAEDARALDRCYWAGATAAEAVVLIHTFGPLVLAISDAGLRRAIDTFPDVDGYRDGFGDLDYGAFDILFKPVWLAGVQARREGLGIAR